MGRGLRASSDRAAPAQASSRHARAVVAWNEVTPALGRAGVPPEPYETPLEYGHRVTRARVIDALLTNFHLPGTSLLALVAAFAGGETTRAAYAEAVEQRYRFYSYGDAMLIL